MIGKWRRLLRCEKSFPPPWGRVRERDFKTPSLSVSLPEGERRKIKKPTEELVFRGYK
jgi:hypothetical protein